MGEREKFKPYQKWRHPPGCPDGDWCRGNRVCYWRCAYTDEDWEEAVATALANAPEAPHD